MKILIVILLMASCNNTIQDEKIILDDVDSILMHSENNIDTIQNILPSVDQQIAKAEKKVLVNIQSIKAQNQKLKENSKIVKTITIRDTIIIKEKTNFWGKKRISTDTINSIDSTEHE